MDLSPQKTSPCNDLLLGFEIILFSVIDKITFANTNTDLQRKMLKDVAMIKKYDKIIMKADKMDSHYKIDAYIHHKAINNEVNTFYKKPPNNWGHNINSEAKKPRKQPLIKELLIGSTNSKNIKHSLQLKPTK